MKLSKAWLLLFGLLVGHYVAADERLGRARWVIVATLTDRMTGAVIKQVELGRELEFDDPAQCKAVVDKVHPVETDQIATVLTCQRVERSASPPVSGHRSTQTVATNMEIGSHD